MSYKERVKKAIENYEKKQNAIDFEPRRTNEKPEKEVEKAVLIWCKQNSFDVDVVEAKSKYNVSTGMYTGRATSIGLSDIIGNDKHGLAIFIELKAEGRRVGSALREQQRKFLTRKIMSNCFAVVTDSAEYLEQSYRHFLSLPTVEEKQDYLLKELPKHTPRQTDLFDDL